MDWKAVKNFLILYKLYHIPFWLAYHLGWLIINIGNLSDVYDYLIYSDSTLKFYFYILFQTLGAYFNLYVLIPRFLNKGHYFQFVVTAFATILVCSGCILCGYYLATFLANTTLQEMFGTTAQKIYLTQALPSTMASMTLAMSIKLGKNWLQSEKKRNLLEKEHLETELKYLKSQINPHFLFNTINSIFALIHKNPDLASESLANFSDMLRYQLYECNEDVVALDKELNFIESFIDLEKLRLDPDHTEMQFDIKNETLLNQSIAPFLLIPFVENAFKHISKGKGRKHFIRMCLTVNNQSLELKLENSKEKQVRSDQNTAPNSGIGLKNVERRLALLYPERHSLQIEHQKNRFSVILKLEWEKN